MKRRTRTLSSAIALLAVLLASVTLWANIGGRTQNTNAQPSSQSQTSSGITSTQSTISLSSKSATSVVIVSDQLRLVLTGGPSYADWAITIENSGGVPMNALSVVLNTPNTATMCTNANGMLTGEFGGTACTARTMASPLQQGQSITGYVSTDGMSGENYVTPDETYTVSVVATYTNGATTNNSYSVVAVESYGG